MIENNPQNNENEDPIYKYLTIEDVVKTKRGRNVIIHEDGSISCILPFRPLNSTSFDEAQFEDFFDKMAGIIESVPENISVQFFMSREKANVDVEGIEKLETYLKPRAQYLYDMADNYELFQNKFYISIYAHQTGDVDEKKNNIIKRIYDWYQNKDDEEKLKEKAIKGIDFRLGKITETTDIILQFLNDNQMGVGLLSSREDYFKIIERFTRPKKSRISKVEVPHSEKDNYNQGESVRQILYSGVRAENFQDYFVLDDYLHKVYTLDRAPKKVITGKSISVIDSLPYEFFYSVTFHRLSFDETNKIFKREVGRAEMIRGQNEGSWVEDRVVAKNAERIEEQYDAFAEGDSTGLKASINLVLRIDMDLVEDKKRTEDLTTTEVVRRFDQEMFKKVFASFGNSEWVTEKYLGWFIFHKVIPGFSNTYSSDLKKNVLVASDIPYFFAMYDTKMPGTKHNGVNHFIDMKDNRVDFDIFNPALPAWNWSISGQTGSGKSVLMNALLTMQFADVNSKPVICILDVGGDQGSYMKFMNLVGGTQINLSKPVKPSIQPLELKPERSRPTKGKKDVVVKYLKNNISEFKEKQEREIELSVDAYYNELLNLSSRERNDPLAVNRKFREIFEIERSSELADIFVLKPGECLPNASVFNVIIAVFEGFMSSGMSSSEVFDQDQIAELLIETYEKVGAKEKRFPYIMDVYTHAKETLEPSEQSTRRFLSKIYNWTRNGKYGMFDADTNVDIDNDVILADMKGVESSPQLQYVYTLLISQLFNDKMYFTRDRKKMIVRDEAWSLMSNPKARAFFVEDLRTARKNGFATISISQLPYDYLTPDPAAGRGIMSNMQGNIFCKFNGADVLKTVAGEYELTDDMYDELSSLGVQKKISENGTAKALYSKFMMLLNFNERREIYLLKNKLHPFEYILYSSSADDNAVVGFYLHHTKKFENLEDVLWYIAQDGHKGDKELSDYLASAGFGPKSREIMEK